MSTRHGRLTTRQHARVEWSLLLSANLRSPDPRNLHGNERRVAKISQIAMIQQQMDQLSTNFKTPLLAVFLCSGIQKPLQIVRLSSFVWLKTLLFRAFLCYEKQKPSQTAMKKLEANVKTNTGICDIFTYVVACDVYDFGAKPSGRRTLQNTVETSVSAKPKTVG